MEYLKNGTSYHMFFNEGRESICTRLTEGGELFLLPGQAMITDSITELQNIREDSFSREKEIKEFDIFLREWNQHDFRFYKHICGEFDINAYDELPEFSGYIKFVPTDTAAGFHNMCVKFSGEGCRVHIGENDYEDSDGILYCNLPDNIDGLKIEIILKNSKAYARRDNYTRYDYIEGCFLESVMLFDCVGDNI